MRAAGAMLVVMVAGGASCRDITGIDEYTFPFPECVPGAAPEPCYEGPPGTENVGRCRAGTIACNAEGTGFEACTGIGPLPLDDCAATPTDDQTLDANCDGTVDVCKHSIEWVRFVDTAIPIGVGSDDTPGAEAPAFVAGGYPGGETTIAGFPVTDAGVNPDVGQDGSGAFVLSVRGTKEYANLWSSTDGEYWQLEHMTGVAAAGGGLWSVGVDASDSDATSASIRGALRFYKLDPSAGQGVVSLKNGRFTGTYYNPRIAARARPEGGADIWVAATVAGTWDLDDNAPPEAAQSVGNDGLLIRVADDGAPLSTTILSGMNDQNLRSIAVGARTGDVVVAGCHQGPPGTGCGALAAGPGYFVARYGSQGNCIAHAAVPLAQAPGADSCRVSAALAEPFEGTPALLAAYAKTTTAVVVADCTTGTCVETMLLGTGAADGLVEVHHLGADALGNAYLVFGYRGTLSTMTAVGSFSETRSQTDVAVAQLHRDPASGAWQIWWIETLAQGDDTVILQSGVTASVTAAGYTYVLGRGRGNIGNVPGPDPIPQNDTLYLARVSP